ncbi:hypothetical protein ABEB36_004554 [Hypothenemus hampei]|uniref:PDZ domain-containing protein n=1 Tax=Hypothenemus hampei TaxID=57062 RepID=A0ABD1F3Q7_HYPHA
MLTMEYGTVGVGSQQHKYACSTMSSETLNESCGSRNNRIRTVRLVRPNHGTLPPPGVSYRHGSSLGFSLRGGREHGTGFFVSHVEVGSEAHVQGLKVGDQIIRINGFAVDDAVHKEVLQLISNHMHVTLKVRGVGMIPIKDKKTDGLSWQIISDSGSPTRDGSPQLGEKINDVQINIMVAPKSKLGCGICKGPDWKPGIFVQFTKEGGIAREAGLRPGDQIAYCNNVDFSDVPFNEAVNLMKSSRQLNLIVRKGAGSELFPGESSGYNSSASSVTGDQSPSWSDSKRLSIVKEENLDLGKRLNHLDKFKNLVNIKKWDSWDDEDRNEKPMLLFKPTIINLTENGTTIHNNGSEEPIMDDYSTISSSSPDLVQYAIAQKSTETKTVVVDVHRSEETESKEKKLPLIKSPSSSSFCSLASSTTTNTSLSSAITLEIQRRQKNTTKKQKSIDEQLQVKKVLKGSVDSERQDQHNKLMNEFKKAHQKMFKQTTNDTSRDGSDNNNCTNNCAMTFKQERLNNSNNTNSNKEQLYSENELTDRLSATQNGSSFGETTKTTLKSPNSFGQTPPPPPPPPQCPTMNNSSSSLSLSSPSTTRSNTLKNSKPKSQPPPVPIKYSVLSHHSQATRSPPPCPTPDYDNISLASQKMCHDSAEMESLESYRINNPTNVAPKPPHTYFQKCQLTGTLSNQSQNTTIRRTRPVSITIGEYNGSSRRQPGKLDFLQPSSQGDGSDSVTKDLGSQLTSELTQTLNRSNLRKRTESMENLLGDSYGIRTHRNGTVRISLNILSKNFTKSTSDLTDEEYRTENRNRLTINVVKPDLPNGILKNNSGDYDTTSNCHKNLLSSQKTITFEEMPTLIVAHKSSGPS